MTKIEIAEQSLQDIYCMTVKQNPKRGKFLGACYKHLETSQKWGKGKDGKLDKEEKEAVKLALGSMEKKLAVQLLKNEDIIVTGPAALKPKYSEEYDYHSGGNIPIKNRVALTFVQRVEYAMHLLNSYKGESEKTIKKLRNGVCRTTSDLLFADKANNMTMTNGVSHPDWPKLARDEASRKVLDKFKNLFPEAGMVADWRSEKVRIELREAKEAQTIKSASSMTAEKLLESNSSLPVGESQPTELTSK